MAASWRDATSASPRNAGAGNRVWLTGLGGGCPPEVVMARQPEVFVRRLQPAVGLELVGSGTTAGSPRTHVRADRYVPQRYRGTRPAVSAGIAVRAQPVWPDSSRRIRNGWPVLELAVDVGVVEGEVLLPVAAQVADGDSQLVGHPASQVPVGTNVPGFVVTPSGPSTAAPVPSICQRPLADRIPAAGMTTSSLAACCSRSNATRSGRDPLRCVSCLSIVDTASSLSVRRAAGTG